MGMKIRSRTWSAAPVVRTNKKELDAPPQTDEFTEVITRTNPSTAEEEHKNTRTQEPTQRLPRILVRVRRNTVRGEENRHTAKGSACGRNRQRCSGEPRTESDGGVVSGQGGALSGGAKTRDEDTQRMAAARDSGEAKREVAAPTVLANPSALTRRDRAGGASPRATQAETENLSERKIVTFRLWRRGFWRR
jgi:hypothetical protein